MALDRRAALRAAEKLVTRGKLEPAAKEYRKVLQAFPDDTNTLNKLGDLYVRLKRLDDAVELFTRAASHFVAEGFLVKAIAIYKKIIRLDPTRIAVYETLADLHHRQGLRNEARSQYQVVADYYLQSGDSVKVRSILERMVELEPQNPSHRVKLAELYCDAGMLAEALEQYQRIAAVMLEHDRVDEALRVYVGAFDLSPNDLGFLTDVVLHLVDSGHRETAEKLLEQAEKKNPEVARVREVTGLGVEAGEPEDRIEAAAETAAATESREPVTEESEAAVLEPAEAETEGEGETEGAPEALEDAEVGAGEVVVLDLDEAAGALPFAADQARRGTVEDAEIDELEIDLEAIELPEEPEEPAVADEAVRLADDVEVDDVAPSAEVDEGPGEPEAPPVAEREAPVVEDAEPAELEELATATGGGEADTAAGLEPAAAAEAEPEAGEEVEASVPGVDELLVEARVLASYGLGGKAIDVCERALALESNNLEALALLAQTRHQEGETALAAEAAQRLRVATESSASGDGVWESSLEWLSEAGYAIEGASIEPPPQVEPVEEAEQVEPVEEAEPVELVEEAAPEAEPSLLDVEEIGTGLRETTEPGWLEEPATEQSFADAEDLFGGEDEFFDLAAELEHELREEEQRRGEELPQLEEQSLEEIVEGFKRGVAETLAEEDYETHYNLGIAYREMGLVDEAIGEFQLAAKSPVYLVDCCSLLGSCFLEKGYPDLAIKWYERGLEAPQATENESLGLLYELGNLYLITGDRAIARKTFAEIYGVNSNYRDVVAKLEELRES